MTNRGSVAFISTSQRVLGEQGRGAGLVPGVELDAR